MKENKNDMSKEKLLNDYANGMAINKIVTLLVLYRQEGKAEFDTFEKYVDVICAQYYGSAYETVVKNVEKRLKNKKEKGG